jgi:D-amino-acid dehydrogenase
LRRAGAEVVLVERGRCGRATSLGNAGWVTPMLSTPLPAPGAVLQGARWLLDPASPLLVRPRFDPAFARWLWRFARNCSAARYEAAARALLALNAGTLELFDELLDTGVEFEQYETGVLTVALDEGELEKEWKRMQNLAALGYPSTFELLDGPAARRADPAVGPRVVGGVFAPTERHVRPETLTAGLLAHLRADGVDVREGVAVTGLRPRGTGWQLDSSAESIAADRVVLAAGIWSKPLLAALGTRIPLEAAKGYSLTYRTDRGAPRHALMLQEAKVGVSPFAGEVRFAGTLELGGESLELRPRRLGAIRRAASDYLAGFAGSSELAWAGLRQLLPDGLPVIGRVPTADGVFAATGHGMLGITLAPATAAVLAPLVLDDRLDPVLEPLRLDRAF